MIIDQAVKVLDSKKNYNKADLDRYLLCVHEITPGKKNRPKVLPSIQDQREAQKKIRNRLSRADESFYEQYSAFNQSLVASPAKLENRDISPLSPYAPARFNKIADAAAEFSKIESEKKPKRVPIHKRTTSDSPAKPRLLKRTDSSTVQFDYARADAETEGQKIFYQHQEAPGSHLPQSKAIAEKLKHITPSMIEKPNKAKLEELDDILSHNL